MSGQRIKICVIFVDGDGSERGIGRGYRSVFSDDLAAERDL